MSHHLSLRGCPLLLPLLAPLLHLLKLKLHKCTSKPSSPHAHTNSSFTTASSPTHTHTQNVTYTHYLTPSSSPLALHVSSVQVCPGLLHSFSAPFPLYLSSTTNRHITHTHTHVHMRTHTHTLKAPHCPCTFCHTNLSRRPLSPNGLSTLV